MIFTNNPTLTKEHLDRDLGGRIGCFPMFNLLIFYCEGQKYWLFQLINIWKNNTANWDFYRNFKCVVFEKDKLEFWDNSILWALAIFVQSCFQLWFRGQVLRYPEKTSLTQVKSYQLTFWRQKEAVGLKNDAEGRSISRLTAFSGLFSTAWTEIIS